MDLIRLILIEDDALHRMVLAKRLETCEDIKIVGEADNGEAAISLVENTEAEMILLDYHLTKKPGPDGSMLIAAIKKHDPKIKIISLTADDDPYQLSLALKAGANSIVLKDEIHQENYLINVIREAHQGKFGLPKIHELDHRINTATLERETFEKELNETELKATALLSENIELEKISKKLRKTTSYIRQVLLKVRRKLKVDTNEELKALYRKLYPP